jgi:pimeloyl-ACP methyl ester carboxylesterase
VAHDRTRPCALTRYALYLHDYGSQIGLRLAIRAPERVAALIIQNRDIYQDQLGPKYGPLQEYWSNPTPEGRPRAPRRRI